jgi:hypothetical protein
LYLSLIHVIVIYNKGIIMNFLTKAQRIEQARRELHATLARVGYSGKKRGSSTLHIPAPVKSAVSTSDAIPGNGVAKDRKVYTGNEIAGIATMHKSNAVPVRKDNKQSIIDIANMRRG